MTIRTWTWMAAAILLLAAGPAPAETLDGSCAIHFYGKSTLHDFEGQAACQPFTLTGDDVDGRQIVRRATVVVPVAGMDTANGSRDKKMRAMFDSERFPLVSGQFAAIEPERLIGALGTADGTAALPLELRIRDVTQHVEARLSQLAASGERIDFVAEFPLSLSGFALEPPSVLGVIKVADEVRVVAHVTLKRRQAGSE